MRNYDEFISMRLFKTTFLVMKMYFFILFLTGTTVSVCCADTLLPVNVYYFEPDLPKPFAGSSVSKKSNMSCGNLGIDESCIVVQSNVSYGIRFLYQSMECDNCSLLQLNPLGPFKSQKKKLPFASLGTVWQVVDEENKTICSKSHNYLGENSSYHIIVNDKNCSLVCEKEPEAVYIPILIAVGIYFLLALIWILGKFIYRTEVINRLLHRDSMDDLTAAYSSTSSINDSKKQKPMQRRLRSLDTVRG